MNFDEIDMTVLEENFDDDVIKELDVENVASINQYLLNNNVYYAKDLFMLYLDLFLMPKDEFIRKFENLKRILGNDYVSKLGENFSLIEVMYED